MNQPALLKSASIAQASATARRDLPNVSACTVPTRLCGTSERNMTLASFLRICAGLRIKASELLRGVGE